MKCNLRFVGVIAYFWLLLLVLGVPVLDFCLFSPLIPLRYAYSALGSMILCGAFFLRYTNTVTLRDLSGGIAILYTATAFLLLLFRGAGLAHLLLAGYWAIVWAMGALGCGVAVAVEKKWNSIRARRATKWLVPAAGLASVAGYCLYDLAGYLNSDRTDARFSAPVLECSTDDLLRTQVIPDLGAPVSRGTNLIWSARFGLAWKQMMDQIGGAIRFDGDEPDYLRLLNQSKVSADVLDEAVYLTFASEYTSAAMDKMNQSVVEKFGRETFSAVEVAAGEGAGTLLFSYLGIKLSFQYAFQRSVRPMEFGGKPVESFTLPLGSGAQGRVEQAREQVKVMYPPEEGNFIVKLITQNLDQHLMLAQVEPEETLAKTVEKVCGYANSLEQNPLDPNQKLEVPLFNFNIGQDYSELVDKSLTVIGYGSAGLTVERARQNIRFQLDECDAVWGEDASLTYALPGLPPDCTFDEPFLLMLSYRDNPQPYFAMWVDNAEILVNP
ncbi:MAG: hypothetical protein JXR40_08385 [Pontiellaceae bacterium]|nr:hypothetical protein [Pontiellaceae bacterium]